MTCKLTVVVVNMMGRAMMDGWMAVVVMEENRKLELDQRIN
jgi:hypothetical protein